jgi:nucleotide-binding universal stress UspA family protein
MYKPLVVGVDGSDPSLAGLDWAISEAALHGVPLRIVYGSRWEHYAQATPALRAQRRSGRVMAEHITGSAAQRAARLGPGIPCTAEIVPDDPVAVLVRESRNAFAVVLGHRGRGEFADLLLGSTSLAVAARAECPVVVVRGPARQPGSAALTLGTDTLEGSVAATAFAFREAQAREVGLNAVHAWRRPGDDLGGTDDEDTAGSAARTAARELEEALDLFVQEYPKVEVHMAVPESRARTALIDASLSSELLVVGARRRHGTVGMQLGTVNHAVLHHAHCPVAVVPQET